MNNRTRNELRNHELTSQSKWQDYTTYRTPHIGCRKCGTPIEERDDDHPTAITHMHKRCGTVIIESTDTN